MYKTLLLCLVCAVFLGLTFTSSVYAEELICDPAIDPACAGTDPITVCDPFIDPACDPTTQPLGWCDPNCDPETTCDPVCIPDGAVTPEQSMNLSQVSSGLSPMASDLVGGCNTIWPAFAPISRETILRNARIMTDFSWSPPVKMINSRGTFEAGKFVVCCQQQSTKNIS